PPSDPTQDHQGSRPGPPGKPSTLDHQVCPLDPQGNTNLCPGSCQSMPRQLPIRPHSQCLPLPVPPGMPISAAYQCRLSPFSAHQCRLSVPTSATHECPSVPPISSHQCCISVPPISAAYQCRISVPIVSARSLVPPYQCLSVPPYQCR
ncbi:hypothetical protein AB205_0080300, partial [Aquarana catesbeiana]